MPSNRNVRLFLETLPLTTDRVKSMAYCLYIIINCNLN